MFRRLQSRNQRSKVVRVKNVLQIFLLLGVCLWLMYQIKHSHDKKKELDEDDAKISAKEQIFDKTLRLGRKELHPRIEEISTKVGKHGGEVNEENEGEHEESKQEDDFREEDKDKHEDVEQEEEETDNLVIEGGVDDIDAHEQEKIRQHFIDGEIEREIEEEEEETEGNKAEHEEDQVEDKHSTENQDREGVDWITHEAREEHYKADDASSAVAHDTHTINTETGKLRSEDSNVNIEKNTLKEENRLSYTEETGGLGEGQETENDTTLDAKVGEQKTQDNNSTMITSGEHVDASNNTTSDRMLNQNGTVHSTNEEISNTQTNELQQTKNSNITEHGQFGSNSTIPIDVDQFDFNSTLPNVTTNTNGDALDSFNQSATVSENTVRFDSTGDVNSSVSLTTAEHTDDHAQNEKSGNDNGLGESDDNSVSSNNNENYDAALQHDPLDENDIELDALPDIKTEAIDSDDVAEE